METLIFDPEKQLSSTDQERLKAASRKHGVTPAEYVEIALKRALFGVKLPAIKAKPRKSPAK